MSKLDIVVFGATGFTGKYVVENLVKLCDKHPYSDITWGVAGRSSDKLNDLVKEINEAAGQKAINVPVIVADVSNESSLRAMAGTAKVLMNCTGPYSTLGEPVVKACIDTGTHYVDMTAELHFMIQMYKKYHEAAEEANVRIVTACGYGSIPAVMGFVHLQKQFKGTLNSVECYTQLDIPRRAYFPGCDNTLVHYGTWASLVHELKNFPEYNEAKKSVFPEDIYDPQPESTRRGFFHRHKGKCWFPYPGPDHDIVDMTERYLLKEKAKKPVKFDIYTTMPWFLHIMILVPVFFFYYYASNLPCFRTLLWKFPRFFTLGYISHKGPSKRNMESTKFEFVLTGKGSESTETGNKVDKTLTMKVSGANPYTITALAFVMAAVTIIQDDSKIPRGGVLTSGAAFYETDIVERLNSNGLHFETVNNNGECY